MTGPTRIAPSAARLTESLRDIGYDLPSAVADLVDNSLAAQAAHVEVVIEFAGTDSYVMISDDGCGMGEDELLEAMRFGTRRAYRTGELGRYGLGLKTASLSQCRSLTVVSRRTPRLRRLAAYELDLDLIAARDDWLVCVPESGELLDEAQKRLRDTCGTVVLWRGLDRVLPEKRPEGGWARRRLETLAARTAEHLGMVFHRFLESGDPDRAVVITVNGEKVTPWNPFAPDEPSRLELPVQRFEVAATEEGTGHVGLTRFVLPSRDQFSSSEEFERMSGPLKWNRMQGLYVYRADRLVQFGGWVGLRGIDEHTKLARAALDFGTDLDSVFNINVAKMKVSVPGQLRAMLQRPVHELCIRADEAYRKTSRRRGGSPDPVPDGPSGQPHSHPAWGDAGLALRAAAATSGMYEAFERILGELRMRNPDVARSLGLVDP